MPSEEDWNCCVLAKFFIINKIIIFVVIDLGEDYKQVYEGFFSLIKETILTRWDNCYVFWHFLLLFVTGW